MTPLVRPIKGFQKASPLSAPPSSKNQWISMRNLMGLNEKEESDGSFMGVSYGFMGMQGD